LTDSINDRKVERAMAEIIKIERARAEKIIRDLRKKGYSDEYIITHLLEYSIQELGKIELRKLYEKSILRP